MKPSYGLWLASSNPLGLLILTYVFSRFRRSLLQTCLTGLCLGFRIGPALLYDISWFLCGACIDVLWAAGLAPLAFFATVLVVYSSS